MSTKVSSAAVYVVAIAAVFAISALVFNFGQLAIGLFVFPGIPLLLLWFGYRLFLRRWVRLRGIRNARERREIREAAMRNRGER